MNFKVLILKKILCFKLFFLLILSSIVFSKEISLLHTLNFESGNFDGWDTERLPRKDSASIVKNPVRSGKYAAKFVLRETDKAVSNGKRSELTIHEVGGIGEEYWYGFSIFLPVDWKKDSQKDIVAQWHGKRDKDLGEQSFSPVLAIRIKDEKWYITSAWDANEITLNNTLSKATLWKEKYNKGVWTDWVVHTVWSYKDDGLTEIWKDGEKIVFKKGPNTFNDKIGPYFKIGIYKSVWNEPNNPSDVNERILYYDEVRIGGKDSNYKQVVPR